MSMIASSLNRNLSFRKINSKHKTNNVTGSKCTEKNRIFDLKKVLKPGGQCKINPAGTTRHNMNILSASIPEIMDIIRNATTKIDGGKVRLHRKKSKMANTISGRENTSKAKQRLGTTLHQIQKRTENMSQSHGSITNSNNKGFQTFLELWH